MISEIARDMINTMEEHGSGLAARAIDSLNPDSEIGQQIFPIVFALLAIRHELMVANQIELAQININI